MFSRIGQIFYGGEVGTAFFVWDYIDLSMGLVFMAFVGVIFGGIHCAGWMFTFPSHLEMILWRVCSVIITCIPLCLSFVRPLETLDNLPTLDTDLTVNYLVVLVLLIPFYIAARLFLLIEALISLRSLPPGAYDVVQWVDFLPHI